MKIILHAHPIIELEIKEIEYDESDKYAHVAIYNRDFNKLESSFILTEHLAKEIIKSMEDFINNQ